MTQYACRSARLSCVLFGSLLGWIIFQVPAKIDAATPQAPASQTAGTGPEKQLPADRDAAAILEYSPPEDFAADQSAQYVAQAQRFLDSAGANPSAPRIALDLYMFAAVAKDQALSDQALSKLVFDYPASLPAAFAVTTFSHEPKPYREFLQRRFDVMAATQLNASEQPALPPELATRFCQAVELGQRCCGGNVLADDQLLLRVVIAADATDHTRLKQQGLDSLRHGNSQEKVAAEIAFDAQQSLSDRYLRLFPLKDNPSLRLLKSHLWQRLSDNERRIPKVRRQRVEELLEQSQFGAALPMLEEEIRNQPSDELDYWYGWTLACVGQHEAALESLQKLAGDDTVSPYRASALELVAAIGELEQNIPQHAAMLHQLLQQLRTGEGDKIEIMVSTAPGKSPAFEFYLAIDTTLEEQLELIVRMNGEQKFRYRGAGTTTRIFIPTDSAIREFTKRIYFAPKVKLHLAENGVGNPEFSASLSDQPGGMEQCLQDVLGSPLLNSEPAAAELVRRIIRRGAFPLAPQHEYGHTVYGWLTFAVKGSEPNKLAIRVSEDGHVSSLQGRNTHCQLRYGRGELFAFAPPPWPKLPVRSDEKLDGAWLLQLLSSSAAAAK